MPHTLLPLFLRRHPVLPGADARAERRFGARVERAESGGSDLRALLRLADAALARGRTEDAERLLALVPAGTPGRAGAKARRDRQVGRFSESVVGLRRAVAAGRATPAERRQLFHYEDELRLFCGWRPTLTPVVGYRPQPCAVLHVLTGALPPAPGDAAGPDHALLTATVRRGWAVTAVTRPGRDVPARTLRAAAPAVVDGVAYHRVLLAGLAPAATGRLQQEAQAVLELALRTRPAVLHTTTSFANALVTRAVAEALGVPWVYEARDLPADAWAASRPAEAASSEGHRLFAAREAEALASADGVVAPGPALAEQVREQTRALPEGPVPARTVPAALDARYLPEPLPLAQARRAVRLPGGARVLGAAAGAGAEDGLEDLLRAAAIVLPDVPELLVVVLGDAAGRPDLRALAAELGLSGRLRLPGDVPPEQAALYSRAFDVFVAPGRDGPRARAVAPRGALEALASGTPVVGSRLPAVAEVVADGITGMLTPAGQPETLAAVLRMMLECPAVRRCLGEEARRRAVGERAADVVAPAVVEAYERLAGGAAAREATA
ncbi:glycosyltransferase [Kocuria rosea]|uniref:glycosyltransferase n=2 Tax=Kocuria TaxID=57493 RepID=UPI00203D0D59|nr:glycosyltransferase [Kocuria rosea]MCM3687134.1 glycosyltransferase [Kocuria rosea]